jgi:hypothetical protein
MMKFAKARKRKATASQLFSFSDAAMPGVRSIGLIGHRTPRSVHKPNLSRVGSTETCCVLIRGHPFLDGVATVLVLCSVGAFGYKAPEGLESTWRTTVLSTSGGYVSNCAFRGNPLSIACRDATSTCGFHNRIWCPHSA